MEKTQTRTPVTAVPQDPVGNGKVLEVERDCKCLCSKLLPLRPRAQGVSGICPAGGSREIPDSALLAQCSSRWPVLPWRWRQHRALAVGADGSWEQLPTRPASLLILREQPWLLGISILVSADLYAQQVGICITSKNRKSLSQSPSVLPSPARRCGVGGEGETAVVNTVKLTGHFLTTRRTRVAIGVNLGPSPLLVSISHIQRMAVVSFFGIFNEPSTKRTSLDQVLPPCADSAHEPGPLSLPAAVAWAVGPGGGQQTGV